jgi:hypothetical protein
MANYEINKEIEPPAFFTYVGIDKIRTHRTKYPWNDFEVGDSIFVATENRAQMANSLIGTARSWSKHAKLHRDWKTKQVEGGVRIWRIA